MQKGQRPGGLTALAVINLVFGGLGLMGALGSFVMLLLPGAEIPEGTSRTTFLIMAVYQAVAAPLLIVSGIGYLGMKRVLGRYVGTVYGLLGLAGVGLLLFDAGVRFSFLGEVFYPLFTLLLVNTTFRHDLVH